MKVTYTVNYSDGTCENIEIEKPRGHPSSSNVLMAIIKQAESNGLTVISLSHPRYFPMRAISKDEVIKDYNWRASK